MSERFDEDSKDEIENSPEALTSRFNSIDVMTHTSSSAILKWAYERPPTIESFREVVFKLLLLESRDDWKPIAWTRKTTCKIEHLEQNVCYSLQLLVLVEVEDEFKVVDKSEVFKCSIQVVPTHKTFIRAIQKSQLNLIKNHLELMPDFLTLTFKSHSALSIAVSNNDLLVAKLLLDLGADVNVGVPGILRTPLQISVFHGFLEMADVLVLHKADIRAKDVLGLNIAHHAIDANKLEAVEYCVDGLGIHTETRDNNGLTLLLRAIVSKASLEIIRYLLDKKASQSVRDNNKMSILQHVRMMNDQNLVELLLNYKPKSKTDAKQKLKHNVQKLIMSRQMKKEEDQDSADESSQAASVFELNLFK